MCYTLFSVLTKQHMPCSEVYMILHSILYRLNTDLRQNRVFPSCISLGTIPLCHSIFMTSCNQGLQLFWSIILLWIQIFFFDLPAVRCLRMPTMLSTKEEICTIRCGHRETNWRRPASHWCYHRASGWSWSSWSFAGLWPSMMLSPFIHHPQNSNHLAYSIHIQTTYFEYFKSWIHGNSSNAIKMNCKLVEAIILHL